ncbi:MAG: hypothetical protein HDS64_06590 [Bacteroidales bacterium]|nr:hypothetical protein [Bacteroidales bacterium]
MNKDKESILKTLQAIIPSAKLPSRMDFEISKGCLNIRMAESGVISNMQEDNSAFEGWAVVIKAAIPEVKTVVLDWLGPMYHPDKINRQKAHYNRFLMRVANFKKGYSWFEVTEGHRSEVAEMQDLLNSKSIVVNFPKTPCKEDIDPTKKPEAYLERELVKRWRSSRPITDEQLPAGLFKGIVKTEATITPRGASQIDLWQLYDHTMHIYELKKEGNESIGIISELMFYVCTIRNIIDGFISYPDISKEKDFRSFMAFAIAVKNKELRNVTGYFTAPKLHSLIESPQLKSAIKGLLNDNKLGISFDYKNISKEYKDILKN